MQRSGLTGITPLIFTSTIRPVFVSFLNSLRAHPWKELHSRRTVTAVQEAVFQIALKYGPIRGKGKYQGICDKGKGEVPAAMHTFYKSLLLAS